MSGSERDRRSIENGQVMMINEVRSLIEAGTFPTISSLDRYLEKRWNQIEEPVRQTWEVQS